MNRVLVPLIATIIMLYGFAPFSQRLAIGGDGTIFDSTSNTSPPPDSPPVVQPQQTAPPAAPIANDPTAKTYSGVNDKAEKLAKDTVATAQKVRDDKSKEITDAYQARVDAAYKFLKDQRNKSIATAIATYDAQINQITKTGDLDKALAVKAAKEAFIKQQAEENDRIAKEWQEAKGASARVEPIADFKWLEGTRWQWSRDDAVLSFGPNHTFDFRSWGHGTWSVADQHTLKFGEGHFFTLNSKMDLAMVDGANGVFSRIK